MRELSLRLTQIQELMSNFDNIQTEIEELSQNIDEQISERELTESEFYSQIASAQLIIDSLSAKEKNSDNGSAKSSCCK